MKNIFTVLLMVLALTACIRKMPVEQGNIMTQEMANRLHTGMSQAEVRNVMGTPVLLNTFRDNRIDYVYTYKPSYGTTTEKTVLLTFYNDRLTNISGNMYESR